MPAHSLYESGRAASTTSGPLVSSRRTALRWSVESLDAENRIYLFWKVAIERRFQSKQTNTQANFRLSKRA